MNIDIPEIRCSIVIETFAPNGSVASKQSFTDCSVQMCRNLDTDCVLAIFDNKKVAAGREIKRFTFTKNHGNYTLSTKFVRYGKASLMLPDLGQRVFVSNCPPDDLSLFLKGFALKCSNRDPTKNKSDNACFASINRPVAVARRAANSGIEKISPLTTKDMIKNLAYREQSGKLFDHSKSPLAGKKSPFNKRKLESVLETISERSPNTKRKLLKQIVPSPVRSLRVLNANNLTDEQHSVLSAVMRGESLFFTGSAGTGKSYLLKFIINRMPPDTTFVTASTGIAACHIGGITLHMFAGIPVSWLEPSQALTAPQIAARLMRNEAKASRWKTCKCLIVDEISMVPGKYFETIDRVARIVRENDKPFGGIQLVLCGDFLQLPPISTKDEKKQYSFQTQSWQDSIKQCFELRKVKRQTDPTFIKVLQLLRLGRITDTVKRTLISTSQNDLRRAGEIETIPTQLYTHRRDVDRVNDEQIRRLATPSVNFAAQDSDYLFAAMLDTMCPTPRRLELKIGAQVMLNKNIDIERGLVNGLTGIVLRFERDERSQRSFPRIRFVSGLEATIGPEKWMVKIGGNSSGERSMICRTHLPLQLAWALSVHKSQGMTITSGVEISLAKVFESGQAYVALSRATSLANVKVIDFNPKNIVVDDDALNFYKQLKYTIDR